MPIEYTLGAYHEGDVEPISEYTLTEEQAQIAMDACGVTNSRDLFYEFREVPLEVATKLIPAILVDVGVEYLLGAFPNELDD